MLKPHLRIIYVEEHHSTFQNLFIFVHAVFVHGKRFAAGVKKIKNLK